MRLKLEIKVVMNTYALCISVIINDSIQVFTRVLHWRGINMQTLRNKSRN